MLAIGLSVVSADSQSRLSDSEAGAGHRVRRATRRLPEQGAIEISVNLLNAHTMIAGRSGFGWIA